MLLDISPAILEDTPQLWPAVVVVGLVCAVLALVIRRRWNLRIDVRDGEVAVRGQAVAARAVLVRNFFRLDLAEVRRCRVEGYYDGRRLRLWFRGQLSPGQQQRIRNFLVQLL